ncbi:MAG TPA: glycosyltransferase family 4 protein [Acidobacteriaceae bacterium]|nr:glycosyltransferase family 4 protein [Acidobacteriaceae bacterium]
MERPRVVFAFAVSPNKIGGVEAFSERLARKLNDKGWDLTLWFQDEPPPLVREFLLAPGNVQIDVFRAQSNMGAGNIRKSIRMFFKQRPTIVCYSLAGVVRWWPLLARLCGARGSVYYDQTSRPRGSEGYRASSKVKWMMKPLSRSVCATDFVRQCSEREGIIPAAKSTVIYSGTDTTRIHGRRQDFRKRYGIPLDRTLVMQVSWLVPEKGIDVALRAAQITLATQPALHFVFCGEGAHRAEYEALAQQLGIDGHVTWTGQVEDLVGGGAFKAADILIQCSQWQEAFGFTVAEAMSAGLPIIASRIGGLPELVADGDNGFLFDPPSAEQLAAHILRLQSDTALRDRMGERSRARAVEQFDLQVCVDQWVDVLMSI